jgi:hypothetical protein
VPPLDLVHRNLTVIFLDQLFTIAVQFTSLTDKQQYQHGSQ